MADPISLTAIAVTSMVGSALSAGVGALGAAYQGAAASNMYKYQAGVAQVNKQIAEQNAQYERQLGEQQAERAGMEAAQKTASVTAGAAASGLDIGSGSKSQVIASTEKLGKYSEDVQRNVAERKAYAYEVQGVQEQAQAGLDEMAARTSRTAAMYGETGSILGGVTSVSDKWLQFNKNFPSTSSLMS